MIIPTRSIVKNLYIKGIGSPTIAKQVGLPTWKVIWHLQKAGVKLRSNKENYARPHNHNTFKEIKTENDAYLLGLLLADGQIQQRRHQSLLLRIDLINTDREILEKLAIHLGCKITDVRYYKAPTTTSNAIARLILYSDDVCHNLMQWGVVPNKTYIVKWPTNLDTNLEHHFIRGYFDGDGSISKHPANPHFKLCGTEQFLITCQHKLHEACQVSFTKLQCRFPERENNIRSLEYGGRLQVLRIMKYLYQDSSIFLQRKRQRFDEYATERY